MLGQVGEMLEEGEVVVGSGGGHRVPYPLERVLQIGLVEAHVEGPGFVGGVTRWRRDSPPPPADRGPPGRGACPGGATPSIPVVAVLPRADQCRDDHRGVDRAGCQSLVLGPAEAVDAVAQLGRVLDDLRETYDGHGVLHRDLAPVDLLEEVDHLVDPAELRVVVLDVAGGQVLDPLDLDLVDHRVEDLLARRVLVADRHQHAVVLAVLVDLSPRRIVAVLRPRRN